MLISDNLKSHDYHVIPSMSDWTPSQPFKCEFNVNIKPQANNSWSPSEHYTLYVLGDRTIHRRHGAASIWRVELTAIGHADGFHFKSYNFFYSTDYHWRMDALLFEHAFSYKGEDANIKITFNWPGTSTTATEWRNNTYISFQRMNSDWTAPYDSLPQYDWHIFNPPKNEHELWGTGAGITDTPSVTSKLETLFNLMKSKTVSTFGPVGRTFDVNIDFFNSDSNGNGSYLAYTNYGRLDGNATVHSVYITRPHTLTYTIKISTVHDPSTGPHYITLENQDGLRSSEFVIPADVINHNGGTRSFDVNVSYWTESDYIAKVWLKAGAIDGVGISCITIGDSQVILGHGAWVDADSTAPAGGLEHLVASTELDFSVYSELRPISRNPVYAGHTKIFTITVSVVHDPSTGNHYITLENQRGIRSNEFTFPTNTIHSKGASRTFNVSVENWEVSDYVTRVWLKSGSIDGFGLMALSVNDAQVMMGHGVWVDADSIAPVGGLEHVVNTEEKAFTMLYLGAEIEDVISPTYTWTIAPGDTIQYAYTGQSLNSKITLPVFSDNMSNDVTVLGPFIEQQNAVQEIIQVGKYSISYKGIDFAGNETETYSIFIDIIPNPLPVAWILFNDSTGENDIQSNLTIDTALSNDYQNYQLHADHSGMSRHSHYFSNNEEVNQEDSIFWEKSLLDLVDNNTSGFSLTLWYKYDTANDINSWQMISDGNHTTGFYFAMNKNYGSGSGKIIAKLKTNTTSVNGHWYELEGINSYIDWNLWNHYTFSVSELIEGKRYMNVYINGVDKGQIIINDASAFVTKDSAYKLQMCSRVYNQNRCMNGWVSDMRLYKQSLNAEQVNYIINSVNVNYVMSNYYTILIYSLALTEFYKKNKNTTIGVEAIASILSNKGVTDAAFAESKLLQGIRLANALPDKSNIIHDYKFIPKIHYQEILKYYSLVYILAQTHYYKNVPFESRLDLIHVVMDLLFMKNTESSITNVVDMMNSGLSAYDANHPDLLLMQNHQYIRKIIFDNELKYKTLSYILQDTYYYKSLPHSQAYSILLDVINDKSDNSMQYTDIITTSNQEQEQTIEYLHINKSITNSQSIQSIKDNVDVLVSNNVSNKDVRTSVTQKVIKSYNNTQTDSENATEFIAQSAFDVAKELNSSIVTPSSSAYNATFQSSHYVNGDEKSKEDTTKRITTMLYSNKNVTEIDEIFDGLQSGFSDVRTGNVSNELKTQRRASFVAFMSAKYAQYSNIFSSDEMMNNIDSVNDASVNSQEEFFSTLKSNEQSHNIYKDMRKLIMEENNVTLPGQKMKAHRSKIAINHWKFRKDKVDVIKPYSLNDAIQVVEIGYGKTDYDTGLIIDLNVNEIIIFKIFFSQGSPVHASFKGATDGVLFESLYSTSFAHSVTFTQGQDIEMGNSYKKVTFTVGSLMSDLTEYDSNTLGLVPHHALSAPPANVAVDTSNISQIDYSLSSSAAFKDSIRIFHNLADVNPETGEIFDASHNSGNVNADGTYVSNSRLLSIENSKRLYKYPKLLTPFKSGFKTLADIDYAPDRRFVIFKIHNWNSWSQIDASDSSTLTSNDGSSAPLWEGNPEQYLHISFLNSETPISSTDYFIKYTAYTNEGNNIIEDLDSHDFFQNELDILKDNKFIIGHFDLSLNTLLDNTFNAVNQDDSQVQSHFSQIQNMFQSLENYWSWRVDQVYHALNMMLPQNDSMIGWWDAIKDSGMPYKGYQQSKFIFEARAELIDMTHAVNDFVGERIVTKNFDLIFHIPLTPSEMNHAFTNFGMSAFQTTPEAVDVNSSMNHSACTNAQDLMDFLIGVAKTWFTELNEASTTKSSDSYDMPGQLTANANGKLKMFDASGSKPNNGINKVENWRELLYSSGILLSKYFGTEEGQTQGKVITMQSVKSSFQKTSSLKTLFPTSFTQLVVDPLDWRATYWYQKRYTPFDTDFTNKMSVSLPYNYAVPGGGNSSRTPFSAKIEFHVVQ